jgi:hypothetical protein
MKRKMTIEQSFERSSITVEGYFHTYSFKMTIASVADIKMNFHAASGVVLHPDS